MKKIITTATVLFTLLIALSLSCTSNNSKSSYGASVQYSDGVFSNVKAIDTMSLSELPAFFIRTMTEERIDPRPTKPLPLQKITRNDLDSLSEKSFTLFKLGHSSFLLKVYKNYWLIDPVFSQRTSPLSFIGPERFHQPPITIEELPEITGVIISHNHYDHLDKAATKMLKSKVGKFIVPLAVGNNLVDWGVPKEQIIELDWWQSIVIDEVTVTSTPAQHFSGRSLSDSNETLWSSWVVKTAEHALFYSGDTGYFDSFKEIGEKYGPFDLTLIETGAYDKAWPDVHMTPEQSLQAHIDVKGKTMLPAHNGTFDLAFHPWYEPLERIERLAKQNNVSLITPIVGEPINLNDMQSSTSWWQPIE